jgi:5'-nucleotidase
MRILGTVVVVSVLALASGAQAFRVLVTNDDGVTAPGLSAVVGALAANANLEVVVVAPATNQSGTGDTVTTAPFTATAATTAAGFPATAVTARPADTVLLAVRVLLPAPPDLVVSGINDGQNITREVSEISGTVGAALTAARLGIPAIAVSQGLGAADYSAPATWTANLVERLRRKKSLRRKLERAGLGQAITLSANFPTCTTGAVRGVALVPLGRLSTVVGYDLLADAGGVRTWRAVLETSNAFASDCTSKLTHPASDLEAMNNGFAAVTPLDPDMTVNGQLRVFRFVERVPIS